MSGADILSSGLSRKKFLGNSFLSISLTMQAEVLPPLLRRFQTSFQDSVTETTVYILGHAEREYVDQLIEMYPEIRNPYAQSISLLFPPQSVPCARARSLPPEYPISHSEAFH